MKKILILSPGHQVYLVDLFKKYFEVYIGDRNNWVLATYKNIISIKMPSYSSAEYIETLISFIDNQKIDYVLTLSDVEVVILSKNKDIIESIGCTLIGLPYEKALICLDKYLFYEYLKANGLATPLTYININKLKWDLSLGKIIYPIIAKDRWGMGSRGLAILHSDDELDMYYNINNVSFPSFLGEVRDKKKGIIFQELLSSNEYGMDIINDLNGNYQLCVIKKKIEMRGGETDVAEIVSFPEAENLAQKLSILFQHRGNMDCDFIEIRGELYVIDMNPRFGGGYMFTEAAGINVPKLFSEWINHQQNSSMNIEHLGSKYRKITSLIEI